ncbi:MAG: YceI family protein, partial [Sulfitobacter sp.]
MKSILTAAALSLAASAAMADVQTYQLDPSHSQIVFNYSHLGFSNTYGMYSGFEGTLMLDANDPSTASVSVTMPADTMITGWDARSGHFLQSGDFFKLDEFPDVTFISTSVEVTGEETALITGDLSLNGVTKSVV